MWTLCSLRLSSVLLLAVVVLPAGAQDPALSADSLATTAVATDVIDLTLDEAVQLAFDANLTIRIAELDAAASMETFGQSWGAFDTIWFTDVSVGKRRIAPTQSSVIAGLQFGGSPTQVIETEHLNTGLRGMFMSGTTWQFDFGVDRTKVTREHVFVPDDPLVPAGSGIFDDVTAQDQYVGRWGISLTHPLLRGGGEYQRDGLRLAALDVHIASARHTRAALNSIQAVVTAYWNLVFSLQGVQTAELSVELAQELLDITLSIFRQGLRNRIDVVEVEAELAQRGEELINASNVAEQAEDELRTLVFAPGREDVLWSKRIVPTTQAVDTADDLPGLDALVAMALQRRPEVIEARFALDRAEVEVQRAENQKRPKLDITGAYGLNSNERDRRAALDSIGDSSFDNDEPSIALTWEIPIGNRSAGYALRRAELQRQRAGVSLRQAEMEAIQAVRREARNVRLLAERVVATGEASRLNREVYDGEQRRLENDLSTPFKVREALRNYLDAVDTELRAGLDLAVARVALGSAIGILLDRMDLVVPPLAPSLEDRPPRGW